MYEVYFGLAKLPFCTAPDSRFYVDTVPHRAAIRTLTERLQRGDEFVTLEGDPGSGKTTVARQLLAEMDASRHLVAELPRLGIVGDQLFDRVAEAFGCPRKGGLPPLGNVIRQLEALVGAGRDALLLVDDAHQLDAGALRRLRKLTAVRVEGKAALRVCLAGNATPPDFEAIQLVGRHVHVEAPVRVEALDAAGTHEYVLARLGRAGWRGWPALGSATVAVHERCAGNPLRINQLCGHILLQLSRQGRDDITPEIVQAVDDLLQAELRGESATLVLPPPPSVTGLRAQREATFALDTDFHVSSEALMSRLLAKNPIVLDRETTLPPSIPPEPASAPAPGRAKPRRRALLQGAVALVLVAAVGAVLWQVDPNIATHDAEPLLPSRPDKMAIGPHGMEAAVATSLATLAEQAIAQSPTGAGPAALAASAPRLVSAALTPASGPRSSPPTR
jgi:general secretion pathway protein A